MSKLLSFLICVLFFFTSAVVSAKEIWYCPMHPSYTSDRAGTCPICNMNLVRKKDELVAKDDEHDHGAGKDHARVSITADQVQLMGVKTQHVMKQPVKRIVRASGYVSTNHDLYTYQDMYVKAYLEYSKAFRTYDRFKHAPGNLQAQREVQLKLHEAEDALLKLGFGHEQLMKIQQVSWKTPWNQPSLQLFNPDVNYWVIAQIFEQDRGYVEVGQDVEVEIEAYREKVKGKIISIGGIFDPQTRTVNAIIELDPKYRGELSGNMYVTVDINADLGEGLVVPLSAVVDTGLTKTVFVNTKEGVYEPRAIKVRAYGVHGWVVDDGLKEHDVVAVDGAFMLDSESRLQAVFADAQTKGHAHGN